MSQFIAPQPFEDHPDTLSRSELRKRLRQHRRALSFEQQQQAAEYLAMNLLKNLDLHRARHIAIYLPNDGEIDPHVYLDIARRKGNRFGIPEPAFSKGLRRPAWALDAVLFPLVGFDEQGGRLGMGGGFYDRTFAFSRIRPRLAPKLIGLAHDFQKVRKLPVEPWDVPLHSVVTDKRRYRFKG